MIDLLDLGPREHVLEDLLRQKAAGHALGKVLVEGVFRQHERSTASYSDSCRNELAVDADDVPFQPPLRCEIFYQRRVEGRGLRIVEHGRAIAPLPPGSFEGQKFRHEIRT